MKLDFIDDVSGGGKYPHADPDKLLRLYDFDWEDSYRLSREIESLIIKDNIPLQVDKLSFVQAINCSLTLALSESDVGVDLVSHPNTFRCYLTIHTYQRMVELIDVFAEPKKDLHGYHWLYDPPLGKIDLLLSVDGSW